MDILAQDVQVCARFNGGANAGHTLLVDTWNLRAEGQWLEYEVWYDIGVTRIHQLTNLLEQT